MSNTPDGERDPLPANRGRRPRGTAAEAAAAGDAAAARDREPGRPARRAEAAGRAEAAAGWNQARHRIGIRELRQEASVYVDLAEKGYTVDITNRGRLVARLVPVREPDSPLERLIAAGIVEPAEEPGGTDGLEPYPPSRPT
jgi:prevent-host-death family protein